MHEYVLLMPLLVLLSVTTIRVSRSTSAAAAACCCRCYCELLNTAPGSVVCCFCEHLLSGGAAAQLLTTLSTVLSRSTCVYPSVYHVCVRGVPAATAVAYHCYPLSVAVVGAAAVTLLAAAAGSLAMLLLPPSSLLQLLQEIIIF